jgi:hypothetical protein
MVSAFATKVWKPLGVAVLASAVYALKRELVKPPFY